jgi:hypothetical protein
MKNLNSCTKLLCVGAFAALAIFTARNVTAACSVWWQTKCCAAAGIDGVLCGTPPNTWRCLHNLVSDPAVGTLSSADAGWSGPFAIGFETCEYFQAACGGSPGMCLYIAPSIEATCGDVKPPTTPPDCDMCP